MHESFESFWPFYLQEHSKRATRWVHFVGTTAAVSTVALAALQRKPKQLMWAPLLGYGFAWFGHFCIEKNRPATFKYPLWSLRGDFKMWLLMLRGELH
jgi:hypothetical protein